MLKAEKSSEVGVVILNRMIDAKGVGIPWKRYFPVVAIFVILIICLSTFGSNKTTAKVFDGLGDPADGSSAMMVEFFPGVHTLDHSDTSGGIINIDVSSAHADDHKFKKMLDFKIEQIKPFYGNETWRCNEDGTCYENWLAMKFPPGNATWEPNFKNKCYYDHVNELQCFPHVHMVGWAKSGTTDMWYYFQQHPELIHGWKETQWLTQFNFYLPRHNHMRKFHNCMSNWFKERVSDIKVNPNYAMLDSTATIIYDNWHWRIKQGYGGDPLEPTHTNFHYIRHIHPGAQIIVMMRNPVTRALSFYNHGIDMTVNHNANLKFEYPTEPKSNHDIDTFFQDSIKYFNQCVKNYTLRYCCHMPGWDSQDWGDPRKFMTLRIGIYYIFLEEVFKNFPPEQVKLVMAEDFYGNTHEALDDVFTFLNISTDHTKDMIKKKGDYIVMKIKKYFKPLSKTYQLLQKFYEPYNKRLSEMLNDDKWHDFWAQEVTRKLDNLS